MVGMRHRSNMFCSKKGAKKNRSQKAHNVMIEKLGVWLNSEGWKEDPGESEDTCGSKRGGG